MPPRSPTTVGIAVETTVISIAAMERLSSSETTVSGRFVFIPGVDAPSRGAAQTAVAPATRGNAQEIAAFFPAGNQGSLMRAGHVLAAVCVVFLAACPSRAPSGGAAVPRTANPQTIVAA